MASWWMKWAKGFVVLLSLVVADAPVPLATCISAPIEWSPPALAIGAASRWPVPAVVRVGGIGPLALAFLPPTWPGAPGWWPQDRDPSGAQEELSQFIDLLRQSLERLAEWAQLFHQASSDMLTRILREFPGQLPDVTDLTGLARQIAALPDALRGALEAVKSKLLVPVARGSVDERHHAYLESNPAVGSKAVGIAEIDQVVAGGTVQQIAASQATAAAAGAVARDLRPQATALHANEIGSVLVSSARGVPSSRAGIELLIAGMGAGLRQQADLGRATADRLTLLVQQTAEVSQQVGALAATTGALTLQQAEHDRQLLDAQLGFADAVSTAAEVLRENLAGAGNAPSTEPELRPLY